MGDDLEAASRAVGRALAIAEAAPDEALGLVGDNLIRSLVDGGRTATAASAWWARGLALRKLAQHKGAFSALSRARGLFLEAGEAGDAHRVSVPLAFEHLVRGSVDEAIAGLEAAAGALHGLEAATAEVQLALVLHRAGRDEDTMAAWDRALCAFRAGRPRTRPRYWPTEP